jgi:GNAT superfamily N-acetyltransferase
VAVSPDQQRKGLARRLVQEVLLYARRMDLGRDADDRAVVRAEVINDVAMIPLLTSMGFQHVGQRIWARTV